MKRHGVQIVAALVVISLAFNVYLWVSTPGPRRLVHASARSAAIPAPNPIGLVPADIDPTQPCDAQLAQVEARLQAALPELERLFGPKERFESGQREPQRESEIKGLVDTMFTGAPDDFGWDIECRGGVCRVQVHSGQAPFDWPERIQDPEHRARFDKIMFRGNAAYMQFRETR